MDAFFNSPLWQLCSHVALLSGTSIGGGMITVMPDIHRLVVDTHHWMTNEQFASAFAMAQASPGPNFLYVSIIGWQVAGWVGAIAASVAVVLPPALICYATLRLGSSRGGTRLGQAIRRGLVPLSAGLMLASAWVLVQAVDTNWKLVVMTVLTTVILLKTRAHPLWLIAAGALAGGLGVV